jgi:hypothetical protein
VTSDRSQETHFWLRVLLRLHVLHPRRKWAIHNAWLPSAKNGPSPRGQSRPSGSLSDLNAQGERARARLSLEDFLLNPDTLPAPPPETADSLIYEVLFRLEGWRPAKFPPLLEFYRGDAQAACRLAGEARDSLPENAAVQSMHAQAALAVERFQEAEMVPEGVYPTAIHRVGRYALQFVWSDGHDTGICPCDHLRAICPCDACPGTGS